jgi:cytoskeletal protein RodZ
MSEPNDTKTAGELLREARERRQRSLDELAEATKISAPSLQALEQDEYHKISGGPLYVRSFLGSYAGALGLDAHELIAMYERQAGDADQTADMEEFWEEERAIVRNVGVPYSRLLGRYVIPALLVVIVVAVGLWLRSRSVEQEERTRPPATTLLPTTSAPPDTATAAERDSLAAPGFVGPAAADTLAGGTGRGGGV